MKFLSFLLGSALLASSSVCASIGNVRILEEGNCKSHDEQGNCTQCIFRTVLIDGNCQAVSDQCKTWDSSSGLCTSCYDGYNLKQGVCGTGNSSGSPGSSDQNCTAQDQNGDCTECAYRYVLEAGTCHAVSDQCRTWDLTSGLCTSCYGGYALNEGVCSVDSSGTGSPGGQDPLCVAHDNNGNCTACAFRSVLNVGVCKAVSDQCKTWDQTNGQCTSCYDGYTLKDGACST